VNKHTINSISDSQDIYLATLESSFEHAARKIRRLRAALQKYPRTRVKVELRLSTVQPNLNLFLQELEGTMLMAPMTELNLAYQAQVLGHDPIAFVRRFAEWYDESGYVTVGYVTVITEKEALSIAERDLATTGALPWEDNK